MDLTHQRIYQLCAPFKSWCTKIENTPMIIRFPFEKLVRENKNISMIRLNLNEAVVPESLGDRAVGINADMKESITDIAHNK